ncbi:MAG: DUF1428 family protein [Ectothiorhodospiraceae bacterium]|nr:DUF1428 family protein [Ectothiorhodospiraceae bacterium]
MAYVEGFVTPVPKARLAEYEELVKIARAVWLDHGAREYVECLGDELSYGELTSFPRAVQATEDEVVAFSWIVYESRAQRDAMADQVMSDPRFEPWKGRWPFDGKRLIWGGFTPVVGL